MERGDPVQLRFDRKTTTQRKRERASRAVETWEHDGVVAIHDPKMPFAMAGDHVTIYTVDEEGKPDFSGIREVIAEPRWESIANGVDRILSALEYSAGKMPPHSDISGFVAFPVDEDNGTQSMTCVKKNPDGGKMLQINVEAPAKKARDHREELKDILVSITEAKKAAEAAFLLMSELEKRVNACV